MGYEERMRNATGTNILKECLKEKRKPTKIENVQERRDYLMRRYRSAKRTKCKRGKNTKKRQGSAKTNTIQQN